MLPLGTLKYVDIFMLLHNRKEDLYDLFRTNLKQQTVNNAASTQKA